MKKNLLLVLSLCSAALNCSAVNVTVTMNATTKTMTLVDKQTNNPVEVGDPDNLTYTLNLNPGTYVLTGINKDGTTVQGTIEMEVTSEAEQAFTICTVTSIKATNKNWENGVDYTIEDFSCRSREGKVIPITLGESTTAGAKACLVFYGNSFNCTFHPSATHITEGYMDSYGSATVTATPTVTAAIPMGGNFSIDFPKDAHCMVFRKLGGSNGSGSIHYVPFEPIATTDSTAGHIELRLADANTYNYRLWKEGKMTKAGKFVYYIGSSYDGKVWEEGAQCNHFTFTDADLQESSKYFNHDTSDGKGANVANILLNINERGHLRMKAGDKKNLLAQRDWQLTDNSTNNYFIEPAYHYTVFDMDGNPGSDVISIDNADTDINPWATLHAQKKGTAIVLVSYDAIHLTQFARSGSGTEAKPYTMAESDYYFLADWSALWGENTGVFVVSVDETESSLDPNMVINEAYNEATMKNAGKYVDAEHDCFYYLKGEDGSHYTFTPTDVEKVEIAYPTLTDLTASYSGFTPVEANEDGSYTLLLKHGRQIVRLTGKDGGEVYQVLTAKECNRTITNLSHNDGNYYKGDVVEIQYDGLYHPANKMAGIYNMSAYITYNGIPTGTELILGSNQYQFAGTASAQCVKVTIPLDYEESSLDMSDGVIQVNGYGDPIGNHRIIDRIAGRSPNFSAIAHKTYFGAVPEVSLPIENKDSRAIIDKTDKFENTETIGYDEIVYRRTFGTTEWQPLFVPFTSDYADWKDNVEIAQLDEVTEGDTRVLHASILTDNAKVQANTPYLIKAKNTGDYAFALSNATLESTTSITPLVLGNYTFNGVYKSYTIAKSTSTTKQEYILQNGEICQSQPEKASSSYKLPSMRWYISVANNANVKDMSICIDDPATGITHNVMLDNSKQEIYDLNGIRRSEMGQGTNIIKMADGTSKKVYNRILNIK